MNNKNLLIVFLVLLGIYGASQLFNRKGDRSFKTDIIAIDTAQVSSITLNPKAEDFEEIILKKEGEEWLATKGNITVKATANSINSLLRNLVLVKTKRVASKSEEKWPDYEVQEGQGSRIRIYSGSELLEDFIVGRFNFNQQSRSATSFIRLSNGNEVYAIDGFLSMSFNQGFDSFRDKRLLAFNPADITYFSFSLPGDTVININKTNARWYYETTMLDSTKVANYLNNISNLSGSDFDDEFDEIQASDQLYKSLNISGNNMTEPITLSCYNIGGEQAYVLKSSVNTAAAFKSDESGIYDRIFKGISEFLPDPG